MFQCVTNNSLIYSEGSRVYFGKSTYNILNIQNVLPDSFHLLKRILRNDIHSVKFAENILIVVIKGQILFYKNNKKVTEVTIDSGSRPLRQGIEVINKRMYYGDYWSNPKREPVNLYKVDLNTFKKEIYYTFSHIRHIHFVRKDISNENSLLIGTGDSDSESGIYSLDIKTKKLTVIGGGSQKFRAVSVLQVANKLIWGSDDPDSDNHIYFLDRSTGELEQICKIDGPAYYSTRNSKGDMFIATTIEDRNRHRAIIYKSADNGQSWSVFKEFQKDIWHVKYFGYGVVEFIDGQENYEELLYNLRGLNEK